jgi:hypothetical protein
VEDGDQIQPEEDVEAHRAIKLPAGPKASDDSTESGSDDFELHKRKAVDEGGEGSDEDFELHRAKRSQK